MNRFARIDSQKKIPIFEALGQIRVNRVFSPIRIEIRAVRVQSSLLSHFLKGRSAKKNSVFFFPKRESIRANRPTKVHIWAVIWGGAKRMGGGKTYQRTRSPENFWAPPKELLVRSVVDFCTGKTER